MTRQEKLIKLASMRPLLEKAEMPSYYPGADVFALFKEAVLLTMELSLEGEQIENQSR